MLLLSSLSIVGKNKWEGMIAMPHQSLYSVCALVALIFFLVVFFLPFIWHHNDSKPRRKNKEKWRRKTGTSSMYINFIKTKTNMNLISLFTPLKLSSWCIIRGQPIIKWRLNEKSLFALYFFTKYRRRRKKRRMH
jgi:hypothetical protein